MNMKISSEMIEQIKEFEGCSQTAYLDSKGVPTIGIGHTGLDVSMGDKISISEVERLFREDVATAENAVNDLERKARRLCKSFDGFSQRQFDALVDLVYNAGAGAISQTSTMYRLITTGQANNTPSIIHAFMLWVKITDPKTGKKVTLGGKDGKHGLVLRRAIASAWYVYGSDWKNQPINDIVEWARS